MVTVSHSKLNVFQQCPKRYKYHYIEKIETDITTTIEGYMGDMVHQAIEKLYKDLLYMKLNTKEDIIKFYNKLWKNNWDDSILIVKEEYTSENYRLKGEKMLDDFYERYKPFNQSKTLGLETQFFYDLDDNNKIHIRIDRLASPKDGVYEIHDYKTSNKLPTQEEADKDRQLAVYSMGVKDKYKDAKEVILIWHYLGFDKEIRSTRTDEELKELKKEILEEIKQIQKEKEYEPKKSALCDYCQYQQICPLWKHLYESKKDYSNDRGVKLVDQYSKLKEKENVLKKELEIIGNEIKDYAEKKGYRAVHGNNKVVTIWSKNVPKVPKKDSPERPEFIRVMRSLNLYELYADIDNWTLEKNYDSLSEIEKNVLNHFVTRETISRLYVKDKN